MDTIRGGGGSVKIITEKMRGVDWSVSCVLCVLFVLVFSASLRFLSGVGGGVDYKEGLGGQNRVSCVCLSLPCLLCLCLYCVLLVFCLCL